MSYLTQIIDSSTSYIIFTENKGNITTKVIGNRLVSKFLTIKNHNNRGGKSQYSQSLLLTSSLSQSYLSSQSSMLSPSDDLEYTNNDDNNRISRH